MLRRLKVAIVLVAVFSLVTSEFHPLIAAAQRKSTSDVTATPSANQPSRGTPSPASVRAKLSELADLASLKKDRRTLAKLQRMSYLLDISTAMTSSARHALIRRLPVTVLTTPSTDGRLGTMTTFIAGGKTRYQTFTPAVPPQLGPSRREMPGDGPAEPARAAEEPCYYEGQVTDCATPQDSEDAFILAADLEAELDSNQSDLGDVDASISDYCNEYPWECGNGSPQAAAAQFLGDVADAPADSTPSLYDGPRASATDGAFELPCGVKTGVAIGEVVAAGIARYAVWHLAGQIAAGVAVSTGLLALTVFGAVLAVGLATIAVAEAINCSRTLRVAKDAVEPEALDAGVAPLASVLRY